MARKKQEPRKIQTTSTACSVQGIDTSKVSKIEIKRLIRCNLHGFKIQSTAVETLKEAAEAFLSSLSKDDDGGTIQRKIANAAG